MVIKNVTYTLNADTGKPVAGSGKPLTRAYFNKLGKTLMPGQATNVASTVSVTDVLTDLTFLRDLALLKDETFDTATWAGYHTEVPLGGSAETSPNRLKLVDRILAYDGTYFKNPISGTASNPSAAQIQVFLSVAEKAYLTNLLAAAKDMYVPVAGLKFTPAGGVAADSVYLGGSSGYVGGTYGNRVIAKSGGNVWSITVTDGTDTRIYVGPTDASPVGISYFATIVGTTDATDSTFALSDGVTTLHYATAALPATTGASVILQNADHSASAFTLTCTETATSFEITGNGITYTLANADQFGNYVTGTLGAVAAVTQFALNPDLASETIGATPVITPTPMAIVESAPVAELNTAPSLAAATAPVTENLKPKKAKGKSIADLEAANKA